MNCTLFFTPIQSLAGMLYMSLRIPVPVMDFIIHKIMYWVLEWDHHCHLYRLLNILQIIMRFGLALDRLLTGEPLSHY